MTMNACILCVHKSQCCLRETVTMNACILCVYISVLSVRDTMAMNACDNYFQKDNFFV